MGVKQFAPANWLKDMSYIAYREYIEGKLIDKKSLNLVKKTKKRTKNYNFLTLFLYKSIVRKRAKI